MSHVFILLTLMMCQAEISQTRETLGEIVSQLEPDLRARAVDVRRLLVPLSDSQFQGLAEGVTRHLVPIHAETEECRAHSNILVNAVMRGETWALRMLDASSKLQSGILGVQLVDLGHYHQCVAVEGPEHLFTGQHCFVETRGIIPPELNSYMNYDLSYLPPEIVVELDRWFLPAMDVSFSVCVPSSCSAHDVKVHMDQLLSQINASSKVFDSSCSTAKPLPFRARDWLALVVFSGIVGFAVWCTMRDLRSSGPKSEVITAFSLNRNWKQLMETRHSGEDVPCLNGVRVVTTMAIVMAHRVTHSLMDISQPLGSRYDMLGSLTGALAENFLRGVDIYFMIGGLVRAYSFFRDRYKGRPLDILPSIGQRYLRYTPTLALAILFTGTLLIHTGDGPFWKRRWDFIMWGCNNFWYTSILHIANYVLPNGNSLGHTWYLAADFQMFVLSPLFLIPLYFRPQLGLALMTLAALGSMIAYVVTSHTSQIYACTLSTLYTERKSTEMLTCTYQATQFRLPSYLLGMVLGYVLFTVAHTNRRIRLSKVVLWTGWTVSAVSLAVLLMATRVILTPGYEYTAWLDTPYNVLSKPLVAAVTAWTVFVCTLGYGGLLNDFLSWRGFQPLAKLTLGVYVIHFIIQLSTVYRQTGPSDLNVLSIVYLTIGDLVISSVLAVVAYICVELPCCKLAVHYLRSPVPHDPICAAITVKRPRSERSTSMSNQPETSRSRTSSSTRKSQRKTKK